MKTAYIVNSVAIRRCAGAWRKVEDYIKGDGHLACDIRMTESVGQATHLTRDAVTSGCEAVVAVGGDGTVNEVLNGLFDNGTMLDQSLVLGIIPLGSGCDLARTLRIAGDPIQAVKAIEKNHTRKIDVGRVSCINLHGEKEVRYFINIADLGGGGLVVQKASRAPRIMGPRPNYLWGILAAALTYKAKVISLCVDGGQPQRQALKNVIIANGRYFGRGFLGAPQAKLDDGLFDVVNVGDFGIIESLWHVPKLYRGTHLGLAKVSFCRGRRVEAHSEEQVLLEMDGELVGTLPAIFEIVPGAIDVAAT